MNWKYFEESSGGLILVKRSEIVCILLLNDTNIHRAEKGKLIFVPLMHRLIMLT
jgi:hypothetical protein